MAQHQQRSFTFPLSHDEDVASTSPFEVRPDEAARLNASVAFRIIRKLLANRQKPAFCPHHSPPTPTDEATWLLHRDITYALLLPILEIHTRAVQLATSLLQTRNKFDLELAFRGEARGAFSWLQCFLIEEEDWCQMRGCPACTTLHALSSEPPIRLLLLATRLSPPPSPLSFFQSALRAALHSDPFWGPAHWADISARAAALELGLRELVGQCALLERGLGACRDGSVVGSTMTNCRRLGGVRVEGGGRRLVALRAEERDWVWRIVGGWGGKGEVGGGWGVEGRGRRVTS